MTNARQEEDQLSPQSRSLLDSIWFILRAPETFITALIGLAAVLGVTLIIPQEPANIETANDFALWVSNLPTFYQTAVTWLATVGLVRVFETAWFWLFAAGLAWICAVMAADYLPLALTYFGRSRSELTGPSFNILTTIIQHTIRIPAPSEASKSAASDEALIQLQSRLNEANYQCRLDAKHERLTARKMRFGWFGPVLVVGGILLLIIGVAVQSLWGQSQVTATSFNSQTPVAIADQLLWANEFIPFVGTGNKLLGGEIQFTSSLDQELTMQLHQPFFRQGWWVLPAQVQPTAFIQLIQDNIPFDTVELRFSDANQPLRFKHPEQNWLFELHYVAQPNQGGYQLSIIRTPTGPAEAVTLIQNGSDFAITDTELAGRITIEQRLLLRAYRLPGLIFMVSGLIVLLGGIVLLALPPAGIIWLNTISKGRGSWVEAEAVVLNTLPPCVDPLTTHLVLPSEEVVDE